MAAHTKYPICASKIHEKPTPIARHLKLENLKPGKTYPHRCTSCSDQNYIEGIGPVFVSYLSTPIIDVSLSKERSRNKKTINLIQDIYQLSDMNE